MLLRHIVKKDDLLLRPWQVGAGLSRCGPREASRVFFVTALIIVALAMTTSPANAGQDTQEKFTVNLNNVDVRTLIETVSRETGRNFIVDPRVRANVTVVSAGPVDAEGLYKLFLSVLEVHGYAAVPSGSFTKIVPMAVGVQSAVPVLSDSPANDDELVTAVIPVQHVPAQQLTAVLRPLLPSTAAIGAEPDSNHIVITDRASNIERIRDIIRELDNPP